MKIIIKYHYNVIIYSNDDTHRVESIITSFRSLYRHEIEKLLGFGQITHYRTAIDENGVIQEKTEKVTI